MPKAEGTVTISIADYERLTKDFEFPDRMQAELDSAWGRIEMLKKENQEIIQSIEEKIKSAVELAGSGTKFIVIEKQTTQRVDIDIYELAKYIFSSFVPPDDFMRDSKLFDYAAHLNGRIWKYISRVNQEATPSVHGIDDPGAVEALSDAVPKFHANQVSSLKDRVSQLAKENNAHLKRIKSLTAQERNQSKTVAEMWSALNSIHKAANDGNYFGGRSKAIEQIIQLSKEFAQ